MPAEIPVSPGTNSTTTGQATPIYLPTVMRLPGPYTLGTSAMEDMGLSRVNSLAALVIRK